MDKLKTVFIAFTLKNSSVSDFFSAVSNSLSENYQVIIFTHAQECNELFIKKNIKIVHWPSGKPNNFQAFIFFTKHILKYRPLTIIGNFSTVNVMLISGFLFGVKNRIAWYHTLSSQLPKSRYLNFRKKIIYKLSNRIIANSDAASRDLMKNFSVKKDKVDIIYNAIRESSLLPAKINPKKIVYAGRIHKIKGIEILLRALKLILENYEDIVLIVIGDDEGTGELIRLKELTRDLKISNNVSFVGNKSRNFVLREFSTSYCTVVPSLEEAFGYVVIESFSVKTPVIGTDTGGISEIVRNGKDGFLFERSNYFELAQCLKSILENRSMREKMAENCYFRFRNDFEMSKVVKRFVNSKLYFR